MTDIVGDIVDVGKMAQDEDEITLDVMRHKTMRKMRELIKSAKDFPRKPDWNITRPNLEHGWALPLLMDIDFMTLGRWDWWAKMKGHWACYKTLPDELIPPINWMGYPDPSTLKMLNACLDTLAYGGGYNNIEYLIDWILYSFGSKFCKELPREPCKGASDRLYQIFCIDAMMCFPYDYFGDILAEKQAGKEQGFFPTPMDVCKVMAAIVMGEKTLELRTQAFHEPAMGTGRMLMMAGDYTLDLSGQDINELVIKAAVVNFYLYVPWAAKPINFPVPPQAEAESKLMTFSTERAMEAMNAVRLPRVSFK